MRGPRRSLMLAVPLAAVLFASCGESSSAEAASAAAMAAMAAPAAAEKIVIQEVPVERVVVKEVPVEVEKVVERVVRAESDATDQSVPAASLPEARPPQAAANAAFAQD